MFLRLWTRAPCTAIVVRAVVGRAAFPFRSTVPLEAIVRLLQVIEGEFLHLDVALLREVGGRGCFTKKALVRQVLAGDGCTAHLKVPFEMGVDLGARLGFTDFTQ